MKETGMLFNGAMVRALLDGRKTQTRRQFSKKMLETFKIAALAGEVSNFIEEGKLGKNDLPYILAFSPFGKVGDRIWVRETWQHSNYPFGPYEDGCDVFYRADFLNDVHGPDGELSPEGRYRFWNASIHMPRTASRILLEITDVRIERLHDISEADAIAEGARAIECDHIRYSCEEIGCYGDTAKAAFRGIWESTGGDWNANPWVWVIEFKQIKTGAAA